MSQTLHIACAADSAYIPHCGAMLRSVFEWHEPRKVVVHFLHATALGGAPLRELRSMVSGAGAGFESYEIKNHLVARLPTMHRIPREMWFRLFLPERLAGIERVLYLDCDTIVLDDLSALWCTNLDHHWLGAVSNVFEAGKEQHAIALGLTDPRNYFNSGVLLMNLEAWRDEHCSERTLALATAPPHPLQWPDQDALNTVFAGHWLPLHPRWNCQNSLFYFPQARRVFGASVVREATDRPGIVHFEGGLFAKPWHYLCKHPYRQEYFRHRSGSSWPNVAIEGRSTLAFALRLLPTTALIQAYKWAHRLRRAISRITGP